MGVKTIRCLGCGDPLVGGQGGVGYCPSPKTCREDARRRQVHDAYRRYKSRHPRDDKRLGRERGWRAERDQGVSRRQLSAVFLLVPSTSIYTHTVQHEQAYAEIQTVQQSLIAGEREAAELGASRIRTRLALDKSACARRIRGHCADVLRDVGSSDFREVERRARGTEQEWAAQGEYVHASWAMLCRAQLYKQHGLFTDAMDLIDDVFAILEGRGSHADSLSVDLVRHQALRWRTRILAIDLRELDRAVPFMELLRRVTKEIPSLSTQLQTLTEDIGYRTCWGQLSEAEQCLQEAKQLIVADSMPYFSIAHAHLLRTEIELRLAERRRAEAVGLAEEHFTVWKGNPTIHQLRQVQTVRRACGLQPIPVTGEIALYRTGILPSYQEPRLTRL